MQKHILRLLSLLGCLLLLGGSVSYAQTRYWVGGTGNWSDPNHWSAISGGPNGAAVPVATDVVAFNASSFTAVGQTVTIDVAATCASMDWTGVANTPTLALANPLTITGTGATFADNMSVSGTAKITFSSTANVTLNLGNTAKTFGDIEFSATSARNVTVNTGTATQAMGVLTVGSNATLDIEGTALKTYTGFVLGSNVRMDTFNNAIINGSANFNNVSFGGGNTGGYYEIVSVIFNGSLNISTAYSKWRYGAINGNAVVGGLELHGVAMGAAATMTVNGTSIAANEPCIFASGSKVTVNNGGRFEGINNASHVFNNDFTFNSGSRGDFTRGYTYSGTFTLGNNVILNFTNASGGGGNTFNGNITTGTANNITFSNSGTNNYQNVTVGAGSTWRFSTGGTSTVAGNFTANGTCALPVNINSNTGTPAATVNFASFPNTTNVNISNISNTGAAINILAGTGTGNTNVTVPSSGRTLYWVGNSGNWNSTANWSTTSNGPANACPPTALDNVVFDASSFTAGGQTVTLTSGATCNDMTWATATNNPTLTLAQDLTIKGAALTLANTMGVSGSGKILFDNTANIAVDLGTGGKTISGGLTFNGTPTRIITLNTTNTGPHTLGPIVVGNNSTLNVTGTSTKNYTGVVAIGSAGVGVTGSFAGVSTFSGGGSLFGAYTFSGATNLNSAVSFQGTGSNTFASVNVDATSVAATATFSNAGNNTFASLTITNGTGNAAAINLTTGGTNTVSGALAVSGGCQSAVISSSGAGAATLSLSSAPVIAGATVTRINRTGAGSLTVNNGADGGGNMGVTFASPVAAGRTLYWVGGTGNWDNSARWSLTSGGAGGQCPPTISDDVFFNNSSFTAAGQTVTINVDAFCRSMDWTGVTNNPTLAGTAAQNLTIAGNLTLIGASTQSFLGKVVFASTVTGRTITTAAKIFANVDFNGIGGGWQLNINPLNVTNTVNLIAGALNTNGRVISTGILTVNNASDLTRSLVLGSVTHTILGTGTALDLRGSNFTLFAGTSTISLANTTGAVIVETGSQAALPNFTVAATNATINTPSTASPVTFGIVTTTNLPNRTLTITGTSPKTYGNITIDGANATVVFNGSGSAAPNNNIFAALTFTDGRTGTTATINGNNTFAGAVSIHGGSGSASSVNFTGTNVFNGTCAARLANTASTELQFASTGGTTTFNGGLVSINPNNSVGVDVQFNNATTFSASSPLTLGQNTRTVFQGTGNNTFGGLVTVNQSSTFSLQNSGTASFANATINSTTGTGLGVTWEFRAGQAATFTGGMTIAAVCGEPVRVRSNTAPTQANVSFGAAQTWNNQVVVNDLNVTAGPVTAYATAGTPGNNVNVTYTGGSANRTLYWVGGSGNWNNTSSANWSTSSGGVGGACPPTANDHVLFDGASGLGGGTVTVNASPVFCRDMNWTGTPANTTFALGTNVLEINGSLTLAPNLTITPNAAPPGLPGLGTSEFRFTNSIAPNAANATTAGVVARNITTLVGTTAALPNVLFNQAGVTWTLNGPAAFNATYQLALRSGTLNTNSVTVNCNNLTTANDNGGGTQWVGNVNDVARTLTLGNSQVFISGSNATGLYTNLDLRGNNLVLTMPGAGSRFQFTNSLQYIGIQVGGPAKELPDLLFQSIPSSLTAGPSDVDIYTDNGIARITFRKIELTRTDGTQMVIYGTSPKTYKGDWTLPDNFNQNDLGNRTIYGTDNASPNNNIFEGRIIAGNNVSIRFENNNTFKNTVNFGFGTGFTSGGVVFQAINQFEANVTIGNTWDVNDAVQFGNAGSTTFASGAILDITANNINRFTPTVTFGGVANVSLPAIATVGQTTTFNANATFRSAFGTNNSIYRFSGPVTQAAGTTLTIANETIGLFVGDNTYMANPEDNPTTGAATAFGLGGNFVVGAQSRAKFTNNGANTYNTVTVGDYSTFEFSSLNTSTVSGAFTAVGTCNVWKRIAAHIPGDQANVTFNANQAWAFVIVQDINETAGGGAVTAASSTNVGTPGPSSNSSNITFSGGIPTPGTLVWVGGSSGNNSGNNNWSNPKNWVQMPASNNVSDITPAQRINGGSCIPSLQNDVLFTNISFSGPMSPSGKFNTVNVDIPEAYCRSMNWDNNVSNGAMLISDNPINIIRVSGDLAMSDKMDNLFNGIFSFESSAGTRFIDMNGPSAPNSAVGMELFRGPVQINNVGAVYELQSSIVIDATDQGVPAQRRGNLTVVHGELRGLGRDITLTGNWLVQQPAGVNPQGRFLHGNGGTVTFNGSNAVNGAQNIVGATSNFWNIAINRQSNPVPTDITGNDQNIPNQANRWVVIQNRNDLISLDNIGSSNNPDNGGNPGTAANRGSWSNGITIERDLAIAVGGLYDNGYQIRGNATGNLSVANGTVLSIGHANASAGLANNAILGT